MSQPEHEAAYLIKQHGPAKALQVITKQFSAVSYAEDKEAWYHTQAQFHYVRGFCDALIAAANNELDAGMCEPAEGTWEGANEAGTGDCDICGTLTERRFYHGEPSEDFPDDHVAVCAKCIKILGSKWYACGCGG